MSLELGLAIVAAAQTVFLAWIAAWQVRAAQLVRKVNGHVEALIAASTARAEGAEHALRAITMQEARELGSVSPGRTSDPDA